MIDGLQRHGAGVVLLDTDGDTVESWSRQRLDEEVGDLTVRLGRRRRLGFLYIRNCARDVVRYLAALRAGHAVALLDPRTPEEARADLERRYLPDWIADGPSFEWAMGRGRPVHPDLGVLLSTSGSTGSPKLVRLSRDAVRANADQIATALGIDGGERPITSLPLYYSYGLSVLNSHLVRGASVVLTDEGLMSRGFWERFRAHRCTSIAGVPYSYQILERLRFVEMDLPSLRHVTQAGGRLAPDRIARFHQALAPRGVRMWVMYGQTEATARISVLPADQLPAKIGSVGRVLPGGHVDVIDGEVVYRGPNVMMGYGTNREALARGDELGGVLHTGDCGRIDEDGMLWIEGRSRRIAKVFGLRINLDEVQELLSMEGPCVALSVEDGILLCCTWGNAAVYAEKRLELSRRLRIHYEAFRFRRIERIPRTPSGKVDFASLERGLE